MDIALKDAQIIWGYQGKDPNADPVRVMHRDSGADNSDYFSSFGACNMDFNDTDDAGRLSQLFSFFVYASIEEGLDPKVVDDALVVIPEYRAVRAFMR